MLEQWELESHRLQTNGHEVCLYDSFKDSIENAKDKLENILNRLVEKERICSKEKDEILNRINFSKNLEDVKGSSFVIEGKLLRI